MKVLILRSFNIDYSVILTDIRCIYKQLVRLLVVGTILRGLTIANIGIEVGCACEYFFVPGILTEMIDHSCLSIKDLAPIIGHGHRDTVLDVARTIIDAGHGLLGRPFDDEIEAGYDSLFHMPDGRELYYRSPERVYNGAHCPTHRESVELPIFLAAKGKKASPLFYPQHLLRLERSSNPDFGDGSERWLNEVSCMDISETVEGWSTDKTLGIITMRVFLRPHGEVRDVLGRSNFEGRIAVPGLVGGRSTNDDRLPSDYTLGMIARNEVAARNESLYTGWSFTLTLAHLLEIFKKVHNIEV